jgi:multidrug resistance efflux pump
MPTLSVKTSLGAAVLLAALLGALCLIVSGIERTPVAIVANKATAAALDGEQSEPHENAIPVSAIRPRRDPAFRITDEEPAYVEAYYRADLQAQVAGPVKWIQKSIGDSVKQGELLAEIDVPDRIQEVQQKQALVERSKMDLALADKEVAVAEAAVEVAQNTIAQKQAEMASAQATMQLRQLELKRIEYMVGREAVYQELADERKRDLLAATEAYKSAQVAVQKATADHKETKAKLEAVRADVNLKQALVEVARKDKDRAQALADYAKIVAPFDGVITARNVGPGSFVQNASSGHSEPLLTVERIDVVTVYMKLPESFAALVRPDTEVAIELSALPGVLIRGKVTRFAPSLHAADRRMRVEVDLYNADEKAYQSFLAKEKSTAYADLKSSTVPLMPEMSAKSGAGNRGRLLPGMIGTMRLVFQTQSAYLVPSSAVFNQGGKPYIFEVKNGLAHLQPVEVQVDDGRLAKVALIVQVGREETRKDLTGEEIIVASNQGELSDGQAVRATIVDWK